MTAASVVGEVIVVVTLLPFEEAATTSDMLGGLRRHGRGPGP